MNSACRERSGVSGAGKAWAWVWARGRAGEGGMLGWAGSWLLPEGRAALRG